MFGSPLLPGYKSPDVIDKTTFPRQQTLKWEKGVPVPITRYSSAIQGNVDPNRLRHQERILQFNGVPERGRQKRFLPRWAILEKKVLQFKGYFTEHVEAEPDSIYRIRPITLYYYLVDDTISVHEPKTQNSGLRQGMILKRQRLPSSNGNIIHSSFESQLGGENVGSFWHWSDLNRGITVNLYGRKYILCDCDDFTKEFLLSEGTELNPAIDIPIDPYEALRQSRRDSPTRISDLRSKSARCFRANSAKEDIIRFNAMIEETDEGGKLTATSAILQYRINDVKIEIRRPFNYEDQEIKRFSPALLKWSLVPTKENIPRGIADFGDEDITWGSYITPRHLVPPAQITIFGRNILITGCDDKAACFLKETYGIEISSTMSPTDRPTNTAFGSSGRTQSDINRRRQARPGTIPNVESRILRFSASLHTSVTNDQDRRFSISFYTIDNTFEIFENPLPGGFGGKILSRSTIPKPGMKPSMEERPNTEHNYILTDIRIGAQIDAWGRCYVITGADRYTWKYAEDHTHLVSPELLDSLRKIFADSKDEGRKSDYLTEESVYRPLLKNRDETKQT